MRQLGLTAAICVHDEHFPDVRDDPRFLPIEHASTIGGETRRGFGHTVGSQLHFAREVLAGAVDFLARTPRRALFCVHDARAKHVEFAGLFARRGEVRQLNGTGTIEVRFPNLRVSRAWPPKEPQLLVGLEHGQVSAVGIVVRGDLLKPRSVGVQDKDFVLAGRRQGGGEGDLREVRGPAGDSRGGDVAQLHPPGSIGGHREDPVLSARSTNNRIEQSRT